MTRFYAFSTSLYVPLLKPDFEIASRSARKHSWPYHTNSWTTCAQNASSAQVPRMRLHLEEGVWQAGMNTGHKDATRHDSGGGFLGV
jgi:hypothetical protein